MPKHRLPSDTELFTKSELLDDCSVTLNILFLEIVEHASALTDHLQKASSGMMIFREFLKMLCQLADALGQNSDLYFR